LKSISTKEDVRPNSQAARGRQLNGGKSPRAAPPSKFAAINRAKAENRPKSALVKKPEANLNERRNTMKQQKAALKQSDIAFGSKLKNSYDEQMEELR